MVDKRVLCTRCISDYREAGYKVYVKGRTREPCDKCDRQGVVCKVKRGGEGWQMKKT